MGNYYISYCTFNYLRPGLRPTARSPSWPSGVGTAGFEPATSCSQSRRAAKLRYVPQNYL
jgi:hypothetical protein